MAYKDFVYMVKKEAFLNSVAYHWDPALIKLLNYVSSLGEMA